MTKYLFLLGIVLNTLIFAAAGEISDIPKSDAAYSAINISISKGYLPLDSERNFYPQKAITRKELALSIDKLLTEIKRNKIILTPTEIQELNHLSQSFKSSYTEIDKRIAKLELDNTNTQLEFKTLHQDISQTNTKIEEKLEILKKEKKNMWIAIIAAGLLGIII